MHEGPMLASEVAESAILADVAAAEERVIDESAAVQIRDALQLLNAPTGNFGTFRLGVACVAYSHKEIAAIRSRLRKALDVLESPSVIDARRLPRFLDDLLANQETV